MQLEILNNFSDDSLLKILYHSAVNNDIAALKRVIPIIRARLDPITDTKIHYNHAFSLACKNDSLNIIKELNRLVPEKQFMTEPKNFKIICSNGSVETLEYFISQNGIKADPHYFIGLKTSISSNKIDIFHCLLNLIKKEAFFEKSKNLIMEDLFQTAVSASQFDFIDYFLSSKIIQLNEETKRFISHYPEVDSYLKHKELKIHINTKQENQPKNKI